MIVNLATETATVEVNNWEIPEKEIQVAVEAAGYKLAESKSEKTDKLKEKRARDESQGIPVENNVENLHRTLESQGKTVVMTAVNLNRITFNKIRQNLFWAYFYNVIMIPVAVVGLMHPFWQKQLWLSVW